jgi:transaldolase
MEKNMKFFLDSAKIDEIKYASDMWNINGVTTNPRHVHDSGKPFMTVIREIGEVFIGTNKTVSVEIDPHLTNWNEMVKQGKEYSNIHPNFVIKVPSTGEGFKACQILTKEGVRCNVTLMFSALQALQAMRMGAFYVSPFIGWKENNAEEINNMIDEIVYIRDQYEFKTEVLVAAVRNGRQIVNAAIAGADIVTAGYAVYKEGFEHPFTSVGLTKFAEFWDKTKKE